MAGAAGPIRLRQGALALLVALILLGRPAGAGAPEQAPEWAREQALELANEDRARNGLPPLRLSARLNGVAQAHAEAMARRGFFGHADPEGRTVDDRFRATGGSPWLLVGENLAMCEGCAGAAPATRIGRLQAGWMASADHRRNLLGAGFDRFGFGLVQAGDRLHAVQVFAGPGEPLSTGAEGAAPARPVPPGIAADLVRQRINAARVAAGLAPLAPAADLDRAAESLLPAPGEALALPPGDARDALPAAARAGWAGLAVLVAGCQGCGAAVTDADLEAFAARWLAQSGGSNLLRPDFTHLGSAAASPDPGRKAAVLVAGRRY